jgi:hypothetical protein
LLKIFFSLSSVVLDAKNLASFSGSVFACPV